MSMTKPQPANAAQVEAELKKFWVDAWGPYMKPPPDGMHPKCLCAKIVNDCLGVNSNKYRYQDREGANMMLERMEEALKEAGVIKQAPAPPPGEKPVVRRVLSETELCQAPIFRKQLEAAGGLKLWARSVLMSLQQEDQRRGSGIGGTSALGAKNIESGGLAPGRRHITF